MARGAIVVRGVERSVWLDVRLAGCGLVLVAAITLWVTWLLVDLYPRDRVRVSVLGIPRETHFICLIEETDGSVETMYWCPAASGMSLGGIHPRDCVSSFRNPNDPAQLDDFVIWRPGSRYGVIRRQMDRTLGYVGLCHVEPRRGGSP